MRPRRHAKALSTVSTVDVGAMLEKVEVTSRNVVITIVCSSGDVDLFTEAVRNNAFVVVRVQCNAFVVVRVQRGGSGP